MDRLIATLSSKIPFMGCLCCVLAVALARSAAAAEIAGNPVVRTAVVKVQIWPAQFDVLGKVQSADQTALVAPFTGRVTGPVQKTGMVPAGAIVARIDVPGLRAEIRAATDKARLDRLELHRERELVARGLVSLDVLDQAQERSSQSRAKLRALQRESDQAVLRAPFAGSVRYALSMGAEVYRGAVIAILRGRGQVWAHALLTPAQERCLDRKRSVTWRAGTFHGSARVAAVGDSARDAGMVQVYVDLPAHTGLLPGEWLWLAFGAEGRAAYHIPDTAVIGQGAVDTVFAVKDGIAHAVPVHILDERDGRSWVAGALGARIRIVVSGAARLRDGTAVRVPSR